VAAALAAQTPTWSTCAAEQYSPAHVHYAPRGVQGRFQGGRPCAVLKQYPPVQYTLPLFDIHIILSGSDNLALTNKADLLGFVSAKRLSFSLPHVVYFF